VFLNVFRYINDNHCRDGEEIVMSTEQSLTLEQRLKVQIFESRAQGLSLEQTQEFLLELFRQMMVKENLMAKMLNS
jgi:hypothetical protein